MHVAAVPADACDDDAGRRAAIMRSFLSEFGRAAGTRRDWALLLQGFWYSVTILGILGAHEMGHYLACRRYNVDATLPYFIPLPLPFLDRHARRGHPDPRSVSRRGRSCSTSASPGPIAGFVVLVPALFFGLEHVDDRAVPRPRARA